jgi:hypothetical protein
LSTVIIIILGFADLLADGFSMATANYMGTKYEIEYYKKEKERESWEADTMRANKHVTLSHPFNIAEKYFKDSDH